MTTQQFANHVKDGLSAPQKFLSSRYLYDDEGSRLFEQIMQLPEYYLTRCEHQILQTKAEKIWQTIGVATHSRVVELGSGNSEKTLHLLGHAQAKNQEVTYVPIDVSTAALDAAQRALAATLPTLRVQPVVGDYFATLSKAIEQEKGHLVLFLGSNIGNYTYPEAIHLLQQIHAAMNPGDAFLLGVDLKKQATIIHQAYDDSLGITAQFNKNILTRINRELGGNFCVENFSFRCHYDPTSGELRSYLVSQKDHTVCIERLETNFVFTQGETISTELSKKYTRTQLEDIAKTVEFQPVAHFVDDREYFCDSLWIK